MGKTSSLPRFWNIASTGPDVGEILLYGDIVSQHPTDWWTGEPKSGLYITPEGFLEDLAAVQGKSKVIIKINSCGGDLYTGIAIHNAIKGLSAVKTVIVEGIAASAASVIMCAGDDVQVYGGSMAMIHGVAGKLDAYYSLEELKKLQADFDASERAVAQIYHEKTGIAVEQLRSMMTDEKWMVGQEIIDSGFGDTLLTGASAMPPIITMSQGKKVLLVAGIPHDMSAFKHLPKDIPIVEEEEKHMTLEEMKTQYPELVAQLEGQAAETAIAEAIARERMRIKDIESIEASVGAPGLVMEAKYGDKPCTAEQLALKAMQKQSLLGTKHLANTSADASDSGATGVGAAPNGDDSEGDEVTRINTIVSLYNATKTSKGGKK